MVLLHLTEISSLEPFLSMYRQASIGSSDYRSQRGEVQLLDITRVGIILPWELLWWLRQPQRMSSEARVPT